MTYAKAGRFRWLIPLLLVVFSSSLVAAEHDEESDEERIVVTPEIVDSRLQQIQQAGPSKKGADSCLKCHDEENEYPVMPIFKTRHANAMDARAPFGQQQCESCHGNGGDHEKKPRRGEEKDPIINFGKESWTPASVQNARCLTCHSDHQRIEWGGSSHEFNDVACASCHRIHSARDPMMVRRLQPAVCLDCHVNQRVKFTQPSHHPVREGQVACSECHNVHADDGRLMALASEKRQQCTQCHSEKRGPFLWEHQPASEDCGLCHTAHGSVHPALLKKRPPQLCQQCHAQAGHPSVSYNGALVPSVFLSVKGCNNCHANTHGSNHPSGSTLLR